MEEKIIILSVGKAWHIKDDNGNVTMEGCTMWYYPAGDLKKIEQEDGVLGCQPVKETVNVNFYERAKEVGLPAVANVVYGMKNSGGKQTLYIKGIDFEKEKAK